MNRVIGFWHPMLRVIRPRRVLDQDAWLQLRPVLLADPGQFQFVVLAHRRSTQGAYAFRPDQRVTIAKFSERKDVLTGSRDIPAKQSVIVGVTQGIA